ncbi:MAG: hypothetical protein ACOY3P_14310 [Planctomycetota bacterium]
MNDVEAAFVAAGEAAEAQPVDPLARFVELEHKRRDLESQLDQVKDEARQLEARILEEWAERGQNSAKVGGLTVYLANDFYCSKRATSSTDELVSALRDAGLSDYVSIGYNAASLKAWVKEQVASGGDIPQPLAERLNYDTTPRLKTRRA